MLSFATRWSRFFWRVTTPPQTPSPGRGIYWRAIRTTTHVCTKKSRSSLAACTPSAEDVPLLPFARAVFAESMRLYPPAWLLGRVAVEPHEAQGYVVPSGSLVVVSPWVVHRNSTYFPEPGQFRPDRWLSDGPHPRPRYAYFPFGGGSRGCLGEAFAWMEGVLLISTIAQHWRFRLLEDMAPPTPQPALTLKPKSGLLLRIEQRS